MSLELVSCCIFSSNCPPLMSHPFLFLLGAASRRPQRSLDQHVSPLSITYHAGPPSLDWLVLCVLIGARVIGPFRVSPLMGSSPTLPDGHLDQQLTTGAMKRKTRQDGISGAVLGPSLPMVCVSSSQKPNRFPSQICHRRTHFLRNVGHGINKRLLSSAKHAE